MAARFGYENLVVVFKPVDGREALYLFQKVAFIAREQNGKSRAGNAFGRIGDHFHHYLRIANNQVGRRGQLFKQVRVLAFLDHDRACVIVERVADGLHLRQNEPAARRLQVDGHD